MTNLSGEPSGRRVVSHRGEKIGRIDRLIIHGDGEQPNWAIVKVGLLGTSKVIVPLENADEDGDDVRVPYEKDYVRAAPEVELDGDRLDDDQADLLHAHYGFERITGLAAGGQDDDIDLPRETRDAAPPAMDEGPDSPLVKRRRERAEELGIPSAEDRDDEDRDDEDRESVGSAD